MPSQLVDYDVPGFLRPCCLCGVPVDGVAQGYIESIIAIALNGERSGEYLMKCATETCAYEGKLWPGAIHFHNLTDFSPLVYIEKAYNMVGMLVKCYGSGPSLTPASDRQTRC